MSVITECPRECAADEMLIVYHDHEDELWQSVFVGGKFIKRENIQWYLPTLRERIRDASQVR